MKLDLSLWIMRFRSLLSISCGKEYVNKEIDISFTGKFSIFCWNCGAWILAWYPQSYSLESKQFMSFSFSEMISDMDGLQLCINLEEAHSRGPVFLDSYGTFLCSKSGKGRKICLRGSWYHDINFCAFLEFRNLELLRWKFFVHISAQFWKKVICAY